MSENQIYPQYQQDKNFELPAGVPMSAVPTSEKAPKFPFEVQIPGMVFTSCIGLISLLMGINVVYRATSPSYDFSFYRIGSDFVVLAHWALLSYFAVMAIAFPETLADDKPEISKIWPIVTATFLRIFWLLERYADMNLKELLMVLLCRALILAGFFFCYFAGSDAWPLGTLFRPWSDSDSKIVHEPIDKQEQV